ncbi:MAG: efflux RND transporter periplasmic adaptor subunit [Gammaproteobacteria bacterium]|nr:efflux RND transporter periplasmic adaptor subunit [Gammaproteobacteria bacterium]
MTRRILTLWLLGIASAFAQDGTPVQVRELSTLLSPVVFTAPAEAVSANRSQISARIEARIQAIAVDVGNTVEAGQVIVMLDCSDNELARLQAEAELESAQVQLKRARQQLARSETLAPRQLLSEDLLEQRRTDVEAAEARMRRVQGGLDQAALAVSRCSIQSPFAGAVTERHASLGELARPGTPLLEIVDLDTIEVAAQVFPAELAHLDASPRVVFSFLDQEYPVTTARRSPVIDPVSRTQEVRLTFVEQAAPVGASGRLVWHGREPGVPAGLLVQRGGSLGIFIARNGRAVYHPLPRAQEGRPAMVDLPPDTRVVTDGRQGLRDGDPVTVVD